MKRKKFVMLAGFSVRLGKSAKSIVGKDSIPAYTSNREDLPVVSTNGIKNLPEPKSDTIFIASAIVFGKIQELKLNRDDIWKFDDSIKDTNEKGYTIRQNGFIRPPTTSE